MADQGTTKRLERSKYTFYTVWAIIGALALVVACSRALSILSVPMGIVLWTVVFVFCLRGVVNNLEARGINRFLGTIVAYVLMIAVVGLVLVIVFSPHVGLGGQFSDLLSNVPVYIQTLVDWANRFYEQNASFFNDTQVREWMNEAIAAVTAWASSVARQSAEGIVSFGSGVLNATLTIGFALVVAFWILMELPDLGREMYRLAGSKRHEDLEMLHLTLTRVMGGYIKGTILQCAIIGVGCGILFMFLGLPSAAALGGITGLLNIIPIVGPWIGGALAAAIGVFVSPLCALGSLLGTIIIQQFVYTFISPKIMQNSVDVHPALTLVVLMIGSALGSASGGLMGALVGSLAAIPLTAVFKSVFVYYFEKRTGRALVAEDGVFFQGTPSEGEGVDPKYDAISPHPSVAASMERIQAKRAAIESNDAQDPSTSGLLARIKTLHADVLAATERDYARDRVSVQADREVAEAVFEDSLQDENKARSKYDSDGQR